MRKKRFPLLLLIIILCIVLIIFLGWDIFEYKKEMENPEKNGQISVTPENQEVGECQTVDLPNYEIAKIDSEPLEFKVDLNGDQKEEIIRVYDQKADNSHRNLPIIMKIFSGSQDCQKEEFSYIGGKDPAANLYENEIADFQIIPNFWGDGRNVIMLLGEQTAYGSGFTIYMHLFTFKNGKYLNIEGPELDELSPYKFNNEESKGKEIIVARAIWAEGEAHYDYHSYQFEIYRWDGEKYIQKEAGTTEDKYLGNIEEMLQKEPGVLQVKG
jgi:hypothetical protein